MVVPNEEPKKPRKPTKPAEAKEVSRRDRFPSPSPPRHRGSASSTQTRRESTSTPTCIWPSVCVPADRDANPVRQLGRQHRRSSGDRRVVEEVPRENDRIGIHRRLLDSSLNSLNRRASRFTWWNRGTLALRAPQDGRTRCAVDPAVAFLRSPACLVSASGFRAGAACSLAAAADAGATPPVMSSICRRRWSK